MLFPYADENPRKNFPIITLSIIALNVLVFLLMIGADYESIVNNLGFVPADFSLFNLFTSMFMHAGFMHLIFNMWFLWLFGDNIEDKLGRYMFIGFYLLGGVGASLTHGAFATEEMRNIPCIGASGAISSVMGAYLLFFPRARIRVFFFFLYFFMRFSVSAFVWIGFWFIGQIFYSGMSAAGNISSVAYGAHIGGFIFGVLAAFSIRYLMPQEKVMQIKKKERLQEIGYMEKALSKKSAREAKKGSFKEYKEKIDSYLAGGDLDKALDLYAQFETRGLPGVLSLKNQKKICDAFLSKCQMTSAFEALMRLVLNYPAANESREAECRIGVICSRDFNDPSEAIGYLRRALKNREEIGNKELLKEAEEELTKIEKKLQMTFLEVEKDETDRLKFAIVVQLIDEDLLDEDKIFKALFSTGKLAGRNLGYKLAYNAKDNLKTKDGVILQNLSSIEATIVTEKLQKIGIPVLAIPQDKLLIYPKASEVIEADLEDDSIIMRNQNENFTLKKPEILYIIMGQIPCIIRREKEGDLFEVCKVGNAKRESIISNVYANRLIEIFATKSRRFRISHLNFKYEESYQGFSVFAEKLAKFAGGERIDQKMKVFISSNIWRELVFGNAKEFEEKSLWAIRLKYIYSELL